MYDKVIFTVGKNTIKGSDWLNYIRDYKNTAELYQGETNEVMLDRFASTTSLTYYKNNLESFNPDFHYQMEEFRDGNILFEIMEKKIWSNAAIDSVGLNKYYSENKKKYTWDASANIIIFNCTSKAIADAAYTAIKNGEPWKKVVEDQKNGIQSDSGRYEITQIPLEPGVKPAAGLITTPVVNSVDGTASFIKFINLYSANMPRNFDEARGLVINDYQNILEEKWIAELKKKYPVKVNEPVFESLLK